MAPDMLLVDNGDVCGMVGDSCRVISNSTALDGSVSKAIAGLGALNKEWAENFSVTHPFEWSAVESF